MSAITAFLAVFTLLTLTLALMASGAAITVLQVQSLTGRLCCQLQRSPGLARLHDIVLKSGGAAGSPD